jgi:hypothetical protein
MERPPPVLFPGLSLRARCSRRSLTSIKTAGGVGLSRAPARASGLHGKPAQTRFAPLPIPPLFGAVGGRSCRRERQIHLLGPAQHFARHDRHYHDSATSNVPSRCQRTPPGH